MIKFLTKIHHATLTFCLAEWEKAVGPGCENDDGAVGDVILYVGAE